MPAPLQHTLSIAAGGTCGTLLRYLVNSLTVSGAFPMATVIENLAGSLLLGIVLGWLLHRQLQDWLRLGLTVGFCGGFTTMSALAGDTVFIAGALSPLQAAAYVMISITGGLALAGLGLVLGEHLGKTVSRRAADTR